MKCIQTHIQVLDYYLYIYIQNDVPLPRQELAPNDTFSSSSESSEEYFTCEDVISSSSESSEEYFTCEDVIRSSSESSEEDVIDDENGHLQAVSTCCCVV